MKHTLLCACAAALFACSSAYSQVNQGDWELSLSGTLGSVSSSYEYTSPSYFQRLLPGFGSDGMDIGIFQYTLKQKNSFHNVLLGLSFFLR